MKPWTLQLPRFKCPYCGGTLHVSFRGRWRLPRIRKLKTDRALFVEERGLDRGEEASSPDAAASAADAAEEGSE